MNESPESPLEKFAFARAPDVVLLEFGRKRDPSAPMLYRAIRTGLGTPDLFVGESQLPVLAQNNAVQVGKTLIQAVISAEIVDVLTSTLEDDTKTGIIFIEARERANNPTAASVMQTLLSTFRNVIQVTMEHGDLPQTHVGSDYHNLGEWVDSKGTIHLSRLSMSCLDSKVLRTLNAKLMESVRQ